MKSLHYSIAKQNPLKYKAYMNSKIYFTNFC